jgi:toxin YoeB
MATKKTKNKQAAKALSVAFTDHAWEEYVEWQSVNPSIAAEINGLIKECTKNPFTGTGKPEPLKGDLSGYWSRRITKEHRLVYLPEDGMIYVIQCKLHY